MDKGKILIIIGVILVVLGTVMITATIINQHNDNNEASTNISNNNTTNISEPSNNTVIQEKRINEEQPVNEKQEKKEVESSNPSIVSDDEVYWGTPSPENRDKWWYSGQQGQVIKEVKDSEGKTHVYDRSGNEIDMSRD
ncbi:MAG: hypothetical protein KO202_06135 [Methanobacteriaceae archaeon]|nr:hypothetical protein [Methanobacteriaceae archaeon]